MKQAFSEFELIKKFKNIKNYVFIIRISEQTPTFMDSWFQIVLMIVHI